MPTVGEHLHDVRPSLSGSRHCKSSHATASSQLHSSGTTTSSSSPCNEPPSFKSSNCCSTVLPSRTQQNHYLQANCKQFNILPQSDSTSSHPYAFHMRFVVPPTTSCLALLQCFKPARHSTSHGTRVQHHFNYRVPA